MKDNHLPLRVASRSFLVLLPALLLTACSVGPKYEKPELTVPDAFHSQVKAIDVTSNQADATSIADLPWWSVFNDTALQNLVKEALANNYDLQIAVARIERARTMIDVAQSEGKPQLGYGASAVGTQTYVPLAGSVDSVTYGAFGGVLNATWEFDVWGRIRHATDSARANLLAQEDVRRGVILTLVSDIALSYFRLLELDRETAIAEESSRVYKKTLDLFADRFEAGRDSKLAVQRAQAAYDDSTANIQDLKRQTAQQENAISTLVGAYPKSIARGRPLSEQSTPPTPLGSTTKLLQRRPEILQAEQNMIAANAEIGVAVADFFPKIGLSAFFGGTGVAIADSWTGFGLWNAALNLAGPIFSGGRLTAIYHERQAYWDETVAQYKQKVLVAFHETSDALAAQQTLGARRTALQSRVRALQESSELALLRYENGRASYFEVLEAQQQLFPAESVLAQTERDQLVAVVSLYKALGGGWSDEPVSPVQQVAAQGDTQSPVKTGAY